MKVFISWSKVKSMSLAIEIKAFLEKSNPNIKAFVSEIDINCGEDVQTKIVEKIAECDKLVLCFTKENKKAPWLLYEAGFARGLKKTVVPILFDNDFTWHSWIDNPMNVAREMRFHDLSFRKNIFNTFAIQENNQNIKLFEEYIESVEKINEKYRVVDSQCEDLVEELLHTDAFVMKNPYFRDNSAFFLSGFESYDLLKVITQSFLYTGKHLWIYGRKNMKLFGGSFKDFFTYLHEKASQDHLGMDGIDFRCLFLDPCSPEINRAHIQPDILNVELQATILRAKSEIGDNHQLKKSFRMYSNRREEIIIRLDNSIIYSRPSFDSDGRPNLLTNSAFEVFSVESSKGKRCLENFNRVWDNSKPLFRL